MAEARRIEVDEGRCIGCWECVELCPQTEGTQYPVFERGEKVPRVVNPQSCLGCLTCVENCRSLALTVDGRRWEGFVEPRARNKEEAIY
ncbi:4Fe-4S binding protein [Candidatus Solincola tengchongensis]|uniref:4Fe-4S binding protein n=1 Tax=Candidatus Solincola tengchongensis TaxID=2900693 RepID=UPI00257CF0F9|nr:4Fe-4S binding protein [Candidatus Solincola tengchongensis]